jgi:hypothetical protein
MQPSGLFAAFDSGESISKATFGGAGQGIMGPRPHYLIEIACLVGYLARGSDPPPGDVVTWRRDCPVSVISKSAPASSPVVDDRKCDREMTYAL